MNAHTDIIADTPSEFKAQISEQIWDMKYRYKHISGVPIDQTLRDTWMRVATALAEPEDESVRENYRTQFFNILNHGMFIPAGRIIAGAGTGRNVTLANCYTMGTIPDSMDGIFTMLKEAALTMQQGGGIGYDFSTIRPKGAPVLGVGADASGPLSFMDVWDAMCRTVMSAGSRRGAMMATMRCDHPDIFDFVKAKSDPTRLRMFNMSVLVTNAFMDAVITNDIWQLKFDGKVYETVLARNLWDEIMRSTYDYAEPGVLFIDRINYDHNLNYLEDIATTNPCGEKPMGPYASCILGSINLAALVENPFTEDASIENLPVTVKAAVRMLDNVIEISNYPLEAQKKKARDDRQIGVGITGLANALAMMGIRYGSDEAAEFTTNIMHHITTLAYETSIELAKEKGSFPSLDADRYLNSDAFAARNLEWYERSQIEEYGIRNSLLTSIAPTGTISLLAGNVSSGIEPTFAHSFTRRVLLPDGSHQEEEVMDYAVAKWRELKGDEPLPDYFVTTEDLTPEEHIKMQAAAQKWVDSSISKTVNVPEDIDFEDFKAVYVQAWESGCKGCTTFRPNEVTGSILSVKEPEKEESTDTDCKPCAEVKSNKPLNETELLERPESLIGATYKLKWPESAHAIYVTLNDVIENGQRRPFEIFINSRNMEHYAWTLALTRMISAVFRRGGEVYFVVDELKAIFDPRGGAWVKGKYVPSILAAIGGIIEQHMQTTGFVSEGEAQIVTGSVDDIEIEIVSPPTVSCPSCGGFNTIVQEGCSICLDCTQSRCG